MKNILTGITLITLVGCGGGGGSTPVVAPTLPPVVEHKVENVLLIYADDLGVGDIGFYGSTYAITPNIDDLAKSGVVFTQGYSSAAYCPPARNSLLTGKSTGDSNWSGGVVEDGTIAEVLQRQGYETSVFGKWGMAHGVVDGVYEGSRIYQPLCSRLQKSDLIGELPHSFTGTPSESGFDYFIGFMQHRDAHVHKHDSAESKELSTPDKPYFGNVRQNLYRDDNGIVTEYTTTPTDYLPDTILSEALSYLDNMDANSRFFMYYASTLPHAELLAPVENKAKFQKDGVSIFDEVPWKGSYLFPRPVKEPRAEYAGMVNRLDDHVGILIDKLKEKDLFDTTLIIITSDNGSHSAGGIISPDYLKSNKNLRDGKFTLYEGGTRVPTIFYHNSLNNRVVDTPIVQYQFKDTLEDLLFDSRGDKSFLNILKGVGDTNQLGYIYWEHKYEQSDTPVYVKEPTLQSVRKGDYKLVRKEYNFVVGEYGLGDSVYELYNIKDDIEESKPIQDCKKINEMVILLNEGNTSGKIHPAPLLICN